MKTLLSVLVAAAAAATTTTTRAQTDVLSSVLDLPLIESEDGLSFLVPVDVARPWATPATPSELRLLAAVDGSETALFTSEVCGPRRNTELKACLDVDELEPAPSPADGRLFVESMDGEQRVGTLGGLFLEPGSDETLPYAVLSNASMLLGGLLPPMVAPAAPPALLANYVEADGAGGDMNAAALGRLDYVSGVLGLAPGSAFAEAAAPLLPWGADLSVLGLDLASTLEVNTTQVLATSPDLPDGGSSAPGSGGRVTLGGVDGAYRDALAWADPPAAGAEPYSFQLHDLRVCGKALLPGGRPRPARVSTLSSCLELPRDAYDELMVRAPAECTLAGGRCYLPLAVQLRQPRPGSGRLPPLPALSFRLSEGGPELRVSMADLLLPAATAQNAASSSFTARFPYCVVRGAAGSDRVVLGARALVSLYAALDRRTGAVGLANKRAESDLMCRSSRMCEGMEPVARDFNACARPSCGDYYFMEYDEETVSCRLTSSFHGLLVAAMLAVFAAELFLSESRRLLEADVRKRVRAA